MYISIVNTQPYLFNKTATSPIITSGDPVNGNILKKCQKQFGTQFLPLLQYPGPSSHYTNSHPNTPIRIGWLCLHDTTLSFLPAGFTICLAFM